MLKITSAVAPMIQDYTLYQKASGRWGQSFCHPKLREFSNYCQKAYPNATTINQEMVDTWCDKRDTEENNSCIARICVIVGFIKYINSRDMANLKIPLFPKRLRSTYIPHAFTRQNSRTFSKLVIAKVVIK